MNPNTHERYLKTICNLALAIAFVVWLGICIGICDFVDVIGYIVVWLYGSFVLAMLFTYLVPVRCSKPGCNGRMWPGWEHAAAQFQLMWRLFYRCDRCDNVHNSNLIFSIGLGQSD